jgi:hypothetical protein
MTDRAAFIFSPAIITVASPKSYWASPGGWESETKTSLWRFLAAATWVTVMGSLSHW